MKNARRILSKGSTPWRGCWFWSKKLRFQKNFGRNFIAVELVTSTMWQEICTKRTSPISPLRTATFVVHGLFVFPTHLGRSYTNTSAEVQGLPIKDCARGCVNRGYVWLHLIATDVTEEIFLERLYLVLGLREIVFCVSWPCAPTILTIHPGRAAAEGFSPTSPRAHWSGPEQGTSSPEGSVMPYSPRGVSWVWQGVSYSWRAVMSMTLPCR